MKRGVTLPRSDAGRALSRQQAPYAALPVQSPIMSKVPVPKENGFRNHPRRDWLKLCIAAFAGSLQPTPANAADPFRVGVFDGIRPGVSTRADVLTKWGTPDEDFKSEEGDIVMFYRDREKKGWDREAWCNPRSRKVISVFIKFAQKKSKAEVERLFGLRLVWKSYNRTHCPGGEDALPHEVAERGELDQYEDRSHGAVGSPDGVDIRNLEFWDRPLWTTVPRCPEKPNTRR